MLHIIASAGIGSASFGVGRSNDLGFFVEDGCSARDDLDTEMPKDAESAPRARPATSGPLQWEFDRGSPGNGPKSTRKLARKSVPGLARKARSWMNIGREFS